MKIIFTSLLPYNLELCLFFVIVLQRKHLLKIKSPADVGVTKNATVVAVLAIVVLEVIAVKAILFVIGLVRFDAVIFGCIFFE